MPTLNWIGREKILNHHKEVPYRVLDRKYSFDTNGQHFEDNNSENIIIHGDNLHALKTLLPRYEGKIKCIYIDPPYNTGNKDWCYNDNVNHPLFKKWLEESLNQKESERYVHADDLSRHDKWLCMMYPRLVLLQKLLSEDGAIFISIDDNEYTNLKMICDEIFGANNFITTFVWRKVDSPNDNKVAITPDHEYIVAYAKKIGKLEFKQMPASGILDAYPQRDSSGKLYRDRLLKKNGKSSLRKDRPTMFFPLEAPDGTVVLPIHDNGDEARWSLSYEGVQRCIAEGKLVWKKRNKDGNDVWVPYTREYAPTDPSRPYPTIWSDLPTMRQAKAQLRSIFNSTDLFETPKPIELIIRILSLFKGDDFLVLDSFAGSGSTAHAVLKKNLEDNGKRHFICIEIMDYAETITAKRVKKAIEGYDDVAGIPSSFSYYELGKELFRDGLINEDINEDSIRQYVFYSETKSSSTIEADSGYYLGCKDSIAYYFCYEKERSVALNNALLNTLRPGFDGYVVYADVCHVPEDYLKKNNITFKKIPRDLGRF